MVAPYESLQIGHNPVLLPLLLLLLLLLEEDEEEEDEDEEGVEGEAATAFEEEEVEAEAEAADIAIAVGTPVMGCMRVTSPKRAPGIHSAHTTCAQRPSSVRLSAPNSTGHKAQGK